MHTKGSAMGNTPALVRFFFVKIYKKTKMLHRQKVLGLHVNIFPNSGLPLTKGDKK